MEQNPSPTSSAIAAFGWVIYGLGARAISGIVFMIGPLLLIDAARSAGDDEMIGLIMPTSVPSLTITVALVVQCVAAPVLANIADEQGLRRLLLSAFVALGILCLVLLGLAQPDTSVVVQATLLAGLYISMALAWMFQNSLLPSVASVGRRPALSLASTALSSLGGALFLILQYRLLSAGNTNGNDARQQPAATPPAALTLTISGPDEPSRQASLQPPLAGRALAMATAASVVIRAAAEKLNAPSAGSLHQLCLVGAAFWLCSAVPAIACLALLRSEPLAAAADDTASGAAGGKGGDGADGGGSGGKKVSRAARIGRRIASTLSSPRRHRSGGSTAPGLRGLLHSVRRMRREHTHATRFVAAQVLYLTASTADGANASPFAQEVVGLDVATITRLTIAAAFAGAAGSVVTMGMARCIGERVTLCVLMCVPPLVLLYTSLILSSEFEFLVCGVLHAFVAGGVGFHGLNRGVFAQMVPRGREAEFFGVYFVAIKAFSWLGPLACALINELTGSLRLAVLSALAFYLPAVAVLSCTDFAEAKREAVVADPRHGLMHGGPDHSSAQLEAGSGGGATSASKREDDLLRREVAASWGARERLLPVGGPQVGVCYGTMQPANVA